MTIELAPDLAWVDELYGGVWPMVDEDRLFDLARAWRRTAQSVRETDQNADWVARDVVTNNDGRPIDAFEQTWGRHHSNHQVMADAKVIIAEIANSVGLAVQSTKITITGVFALTATRLMHAKMNSSYLPAPSAEEAYRSVVAGADDYRAGSPSTLRIHRGADQRIRVPADDGDSRPDQARLTRRRGLPQQTPDRSVGDVAAA